MEGSVGSEVAVGASVISGIAVAAEDSAFSAGAVASVDGVAEGSGVSAASAEGLSEGAGETVASAEGACEGMGDAVASAAGVCKGEGAIVFSAVRSASGSGVEVVLEVGGSGVSSAMRKTMFSISANGRAESLFQKAAPARWLSDSMKRSVSSELMGRRLESSVHPESTPFGESTWISS